MMVLPPRRRKTSREQSATGMDRYALGFAILGAMTFAGALLTLCAVVTLTALMMRSELRWAQMLGALTALPVASQPAALPVFESPLPLPPPAEEPPTPEPTPALIETPTETPTEAPPEIPLETLPPPEEQPFIDPMDDNGMDNNGMDDNGMDNNTADDGPPPISDGGAYQATYGPRIDALIGSLNTLNDLLANQQLGDGNWRGQFNDRTNELRQITNELSGAVPPFEFSAQHYDLVNTMNQCLGALNRVEEAINFDDMENLQSGAADFGACSPTVVNLGNQIISWR